MIRSDIKTALQALGYGTDTDTQQNEAINVDGAIRVASGCTAGRGRSCTDGDGRPGAGRGRLER
jgi:hypothetical protein